MMPLRAKVAGFLSRPQPAPIVRCEIATHGPLIVLIASDGRQLVHAAAYGLAAGFWSQDVRPVRRMADRHQAGTGRVNCRGETDTASPLRGIKQTGQGRDALSLHSRTMIVRPA